MLRAHVKLRLLGQGMDATHSFPVGDSVTVQDIDGKTIFQIEVVEIHDPWRWLRGWRKKVNR